MLRARFSVCAGALVLAAATAGAVPTAERITADNAAAHLFGGSDAAGGVDDWYLSNGVVEAIVDDVGPQADLVPLLGPDTPPKQSFAARSGGTLVDVGLVGRDNDQLGQMFTVGGLSTSTLVVYRSITAGIDGDTASVSASGVIPGFDDGPTPIPPDDLEIVTTYSVAGSDPFLTLTTTVTNHHPTNTAGALVTVLDPIIWTQRGIVPFTPLPERGFRHGLLDFDNLFAAVETQVLFAAGPGNVGPGDGAFDPISGKRAGEVAYGILPDEVSVDPDGDGPTPPIVTASARYFGVSNNTTTAFGVLPPAVPGGGLPPGGVLRVRRRLFVGGRNDVSSVSNRILPVVAAREGFATGTISGLVTRADGTPSPASIIATRTGGPANPFAAGTPVTQVRAGDDGLFADVVVPEGTYDLQVRTPERPPVTVSGVNVTAGANTAVTVPPFVAVGAIRLRAVETRRGRDPALPVRVVVTGIRGTADPVFRRFFDAVLFDPAGGPDTDLRPETFAGGPAQGNVVLVGTEPVTVPIHTGTYEVIATRGPEYTIQRARVKVKARKRRDVMFRLRRIVSTTDALSADFHVHSGRSFDSSAPLQDRVLSFAAEGVEVMVATDHDVHTDYGPVIAGLNLGDRIASIPGNEVTTAVTNPPSFEASIGHLNAWPQAFDPLARKRGAIEDEFVAPNVLYTRLRARGAVVVQYNHPRDTLSGLTSLGFFTNIGYDPDKRLDEAPNAVLLDRDVLGPGRSVDNPLGTRNLDFNALEVANGLGVPSYLAVRRDWLSLLNQTDFTTIPFIAGTAVSDSHRLTVETPGYFRTYVLGAGDDPSRFDLSLFNAHVLSGAMVGTNGPHVRAHIETADGAVDDPGEVVQSASGAATLVITVDAAPWIPVQQVRVIANGFVVRTFDAASEPAVRPAPRNPYSRAPRGVRRFSARLPFTVAQDTYFIVEAGAPLDPAPAAVDPVARLVPGLVPIAFTNPIFVDRGGDGITPPGLPVMATATGAGETLPAFATVTWGDGGTSRAAAPGARVPDAAEQRARLARARRRHTPEYFPLFALRLPADQTVPSR